MAARKEEIAKWVKDGLSIVKIEVLLTRSGTTVPYRTLHRFAAEECGFRARGTSMRVLDGEPGVECQIDFAQMGFITDAETGRRRKVHALIFTAVLSRHMFVHLSYSQTLTEVIAGCEAAWAYLRWRVQGPDPGQPETRRHRRGPGEPAVVGGLAGLRAARRFRHRPGESPLPAGQTEGRAGRAVRPRELLRRRNLRHACRPRRPRPPQWCTKTAGMRIHGTIAARPLEVFNDAGSRCAAAGPTGLRRAVAAVGEGAPRPPSVD